MEEAVEKFCDVVVDMVDDMQVDTCWVGGDCYLLKQMPDMDSSLMVEAQQAYSAEWGEEERIASAAVVAESVAVREGIRTTTARQPSKAVGEPVHPRPAQDLTYRCRSIHCQNPHRFCAALS